MVLSFYLKHVERLAGNWPCIKSKKKKKKLARLMASRSSKDHKGPDPCPICLEPVKEEAYLDRCFHSFCYRCIVQWSNVVSKKHSQAKSSMKCPLCMTENFSIVHGFNGENFQQHYISQSHDKNNLSSAHQFRLQWYNSNARVSRKESDVHLYWKLLRYLRRNIWLENWLRREIQALTQQEDVEIIVHHIHGAIENFIRRQQQDHIKNVMPEDKRKRFRELISDVARPFLFGRTERFVDELESFLVLGLTVDAYDAICMQNLPGASTSSD
ncbi:uncharacterized protein A4U43_UnF6780 [Asparagus officinalis]|uniref:RING-type domain-containing protein n=1 Tax=Asparagus officinalis TaxID=4686 RepID=A0A1R3L6D4_ASPOF|nr:tripartite motif-containing protein 40-like [Asparagus officinalis]XP_020250328.1 tripartite motif-containing protein 40-like [Asparagus officinalis]XP_020250329.1 tripartite motif-containing protein 40-like [Asparagus officinalis]XP_020250330.1 tripartite motif-containing protein 40-like [Asparagus officinalis]ONK55176.1 uncharacterized protein A4U43_UnF6780 [Asparagus officinalis]